MINTMTPVTRVLEMISGARKQRRALGLSLALVGIVSSLSSSALSADLTDGMEVVRLYPGPAPGSEGARQQEVAVGSRVYNVTVPTLTIFRPRAGAATDAAVIIAPGGGFVRLAMDGEGYAVARYLAERGITAIVLKYRTDETPADRIPTAPPTGAGKQGPALESAPSRRPASGGVASPRPAPNTSLGAHQAVADGVAAVRFVRAHAGAWGVSPQRVGFVGFSAGAFVAMELALDHDAASRPDFVGAIYAPRPADMVVPADAPPLFLAVAADDETVHAAPSLSIFQDWRTAGRSAELHVFESGRHGFGMSRQQKDSDHWIDEYLWWLRAANGAVKLPDPPAAQATP
jgi:acetyl esterase/lipase